MRIRWVLGLMVLAGCPDNKYPPDYAINWTLKNMGSADITMWGVDLRARDKTCDTGQVCKSDTPKINLVPNASAATLSLGPGSLDQTDVVVNGLDSLGTALLPPCTEHINLTGLFTDVTAVWDGVEVMITVP